MGCDEEATMDIVDNWVDAWLEVFGDQDCGPDIVRRDSFEAASLLVKSKWKRKLIGITCVSSMIL